MSRQNLLLSILAVLVAIVIAMLIILISIDPTGGTETDEPLSETSAPSDTSEAEQNVPSVLFKSDLSQYEQFMDVADEKYLILVNKTSTIDESFRPESLVKVKDAHKDIELSKTAEMALEAMFKEMRAQGFGNVFVTSAYRSYTYQSSLFNTYINQEMAKGISYEKAKERVLTYSAYPGTSEHHTGLAADLMTSSMTELDESFADDPVYPWLLENAWKFGFILRYPEDKTDVTGYSFEPWHYRFVGRYHAYKIYSEGLCLEEYLEKISG